MSLTGLVSDWDEFRFFPAGSVTLTHYLHQWSGKSEQSRLLLTFSPLI